MRDDVRPLTLAPEEVDDAEQRLVRAHALEASSHAGGAPAQPVPHGAPEGARQPVHTVYGGAHLFRAESAQKLGQLALRTLAEYVPSPADLAALAAPLGRRSSEADGTLDEARAERLYKRIEAKLTTEPVEDQRIDFEDGYGHRSDEEEDTHAASAAREVARGMRDGLLAPSLGIRIKPLVPAHARRALRTLDIFLGTLAPEAFGVPQGFCVTLPKTERPAEVEVLARTLSALEVRLGLAPHAVRIEIMVESPRALFTEDGRLALRPLIEAGDGRVRAVHFGTYDYTASLGITAGYQTMSHPACAFAREIMQVATYGMPVFLADGATNVLPLPIHRARSGQTQTLGDAERDENRAAVLRAMRLHFDNVRASLARGFYQGWDLHPAQLPMRYAAVYSFFDEQEAAAVSRLANFVDKAAQATRVGTTFDDAATGQGLLNFFLRAIACGAMGEEEAARATSLTVEELRGRSFARIAARRRTP